MEGPQDVTTTLQGTADSRNLQHPLPTVVRTP
jgi:hypothetical protein